MEKGYGLDILAGYPFRNSTIELDAYRLVSTLASSQFLASKAQGGVDSELWMRLKSHECQEISRLLVSLAVISRSNIDAGRFDENLERVVGKLFSGASTHKKEKELDFREACNKIIHATSLKFDISDDTSLECASLPVDAILYGEHNSKQWKAILNIFDFAVCVVSTIR